MKEGSRQLRGPVTSSRGGRGGGKKRPRTADGDETTKKAQSPDGKSKTTIPPLSPPDNAANTKTVSEPAAEVVGASVHPVPEGLFPGIMQAPPPHYLSSPPPRHPPPHLAFIPPPRHGYPMKMISLKEHESILAEMNARHTETLANYAGMQRAHKELQMHQNKFNEEKTNIEERVQKLSSDYKEAKKELTATKSKLKSALDRLAKKESARKEAITAKRAAETTLEKEVKKAAKKAELQAAKVAAAPPRKRGIKQEDSDKKWMEIFVQLQAFKAKFGHCNVTRRDPTYLALGHWVQRQRKNYMYHCKGRNHSSGAKPTITPERIRLLNEVGIEWSRISGPVKTWNERLEQLKEYKAKQGNTRVPQACHDPPGLGHWVQSQRKAYSWHIGKRQKPKDKDNAHHITEEQIEKLEEIDFEFSLRNRSCQKLPAITPTPNDTEHNGESFQQDTHLTTLNHLQQTTFDIF
mmetsp:Transcript_23137/g.35097  ORF Transcript_23137/g.35097 Transcript_23137/m.35097 type:complete len:464 (+) Transcript_23137:87-1478(+)